MFEFITGDLSGLDTDELAAYRDLAEAEFKSRTAAGTADLQFLQDMKAALAAIKVAEDAEKLKAEINADLGAEDEESDEDAGDDEDESEEDSDEEEDTDEEDEEDSDSEVSEDEVDADVESSEELSAEGEEEAAEAVVSEDAVLAVVESAVAAALTKMSEATEETETDEESEETESESTDVSIKDLGQDDVDVSELAQQRLQEPGKVRLASGDFSRDALRRDLGIALKNQAKGTDGEIIWLGTVEDDFAPDVELSAHDTNHNFEAITASIGKYMTEDYIVSDDDAPFALTAGGCCAPPDVLRDLRSFCEATGLYTLPRVAAPHGRLTYCLPSNACGLTVDVFEWLEECDPNAPAQPDKPCQTIDCGLTEDTAVNAFGWCFEYSNGTERFNSEQLEYWLAEARCRFEHIVSQRLLDLVLTHPRVAAATAQEACPAAGSGVTADLYEILAVKFNEMRNILCNPSLRPNVVAPIWLESLVDVNNTRQGTGSTRTFSSIVAELGGTVQFVHHWQEPAAGACVFPEDVELLIHAPGVFREVDGGELNFGLMRDSELNKQNKVRIAYERWNSIAVFGPDCSFKTLTISGLCPNGATGPRVDSCE